MLRLIAVAGLFAAAGTLCASPITLSFTQYFDYPGIAGHPSATWTTVFDLANHPLNPFDTSIPTVNQDAISDRLQISGLKTPKIVQWDGDKILSAQPVNGVFFNLVDFPPFGFKTFIVNVISSFGHCNQPCTDPAIGPDMTFPDPVILRAQTPDVFIGVATVPEPSALALVLLGFAVLALRSNRAERVVVTRSITST